MGVSGGEKGMIFVKKLLGYLRRKNENLHRKTEVLRVVESGLY